MPVAGVGGGTSSQCYGGHGERETPGLIPNPEAKPLSADGTARGTGWESRTPPDITPRNGVTATAVAPFLHFLATTGVLYRDKAHLGWPPAYFRADARWIGSWA